MCLYIITNAKLQQQITQNIHRVLSECMYLSDCRSTSYSFLDEIFNLSRRIRLRIMCYCLVT